MIDVDAGLLAEVRTASLAEATAYLLGAAHDASVSACHRTTRFTQNDRRWLEVLSLLLQKLDFGSWIYREGRERSVWALETSWRAPALMWSTPAEEADVRGYFDAEGGVPRVAGTRFYVQFVQKDREDLRQVRNALGDLGIRCGRLHNPSYRVAPDYWRFYVAASSHQTFVELVSSWHPRKRARLETELGRLRACGRDLTGTCLRCGG